MKKSTIPTPAALKGKVAPKSLQDAVAWEIAQAVKANRDKGVETIGTPLAEVLREAGLPRRLRVKGIR